MSEAIVPSYRVAREPAGAGWRMLAVAGALLGLLALAAAGWWGWQRLGGGVPVIEADPRPFKVRPEDPGGLRVPNQSELILERPAQRAQSPAQAGRPAAVAPPAESPNIEGLRAAVMPPPAAAPPAAAPAAPPPPAAATAMPAAAPTAPAAPRGMFGGQVTVQLGALPTAEAARAEWERLVRRLPELEGRSPAILRLDREGQPPLFRLRLGGLADQEAAARLCEQVRARGGACAVVRN